MKEFSHCPIIFLYTQDMIIPVCFLVLRVFCISEHFKDYLRHVPIFFLSTMHQMQAALCYNFEL